VKVLLFNHGEEEFKVKEGDRIAQLVLERVSAAGF
jgi:dUTP pyrophosphatase